MMDGIPSVSVPWTFHLYQSLAFSSLTELETSKAKLTWLLHASLSCERYPELSVLRRLLGPPVLWAPVPVPAPHQGLSLGPPCPQGFPAPSALTGRQGRTTCPRRECGPRTRPGSSPHEAGEPTGQPTRREKGAGAASVH